MKLVGRVCNLYFLDSLLIFTWLSMFTFVTIKMAFPFLLSEEFMELYGLAGFFFLTTGRFMANFGHSPLVEMPATYGLVFSAFYFTKGTYEWWFAVGPTCIACLCWPGIKYLWENVKPVPVVTDRELIRERIWQTRKSLPEEKAK